VTPDFGIYHRRNYGTYVFVPESALRKREVGAIHRTFYALLDELLPRSVRAQLEDLIETSGESIERPPHLCTEMLDIGLIRDHPLGVMSPRRYANAVWQMMSSSESRASVKDAVKRALESTNGASAPAKIAARRTRDVVRAARSIMQVFEHSRPEDEVAEQWFLPVSDAEIEASNSVWFHERLPREFDRLLTHHSEIPVLSNIPDDPRGMLDLRVGEGPPFGLYVDAKAITGKKVMELGCGCGWFGRIISAHCVRYLGIDYSTAALKIARLASPANASYVHPRRQSSLAAHHQTVDTVVGHDLFVHHNLDGGRSLLGFIEPFIKRGGLLYATFYWPTPDSVQDDVYPALHPPTDRPLSKFAYASSDIARLIADRPFNVVSEAMDAVRQRRFAILEKTAYLD
jgi:2-polyprenyl-3-methyl-5-hydroxy-6-metoxy-1,4-benzoquinol methylase